MKKAIVLQCVYGFECLVEVTKDLFTMRVHLVSTIACVITILLFVVNFSGVTSSPGKLNFVILLSC